MKPAVERAVEELRESFAPHRVVADDDGQGGARVTVEALHIGEQYSPSVSNVEFAITFQYPDADVYPHFLTHPLKRVDGGQLGEGFSETKWNGGSRIQVSRRSNRRASETDTASNKLHKVLEWIRTR